MPAVTRTGAVPTETGSYKPRPSAPEFTDVAVVMRAPVAVVGVIGLAAFLIQEITFGSGTILPKM
jgi:hypothetical protein